MSNAAHDTGVRKSEPGELPPHRQIRLSGVEITLGRRIASGRYSVVYAGRDEWDTPLAVKIYRNYAPEGIWRNEVSQLRRFVHRNVVELRGAFELQSHRYVLLRYSGQPVTRLRLVAPDGLRERLALRIARGLLQALHYIHEAEHVHGDINPLNCLVWRRGDIMEVRLADLAFCRPLNAVQDELARFAQWMPLPERLDPAHGELGPKSDVYLAALVLYQHMIGGVLDASPAHAVSGVFQQQAACHQVALVRELAPALSVDARERPSAMELWRTLKRAVREGPFDTSRR